jgi:hypothetical protein
MRRLRWSAAIGLAAAMLAIACSPAVAAKSGHRKLVPASGHLTGLTGGQLLGEELRQLFELPFAENPLAGAGDSCFAAGNNNKVLIVWTREVAPTCTVKPGTPIFLFAYFAECSNKEAPPFFGGETEAGQRQCALNVLRETGVFDAILVSIDRRGPVDIYSDRYLAVSPQVTANVPTSNIFDVPGPTEVTFVAAAWVAMIRPLPPGTHTIRVELVGTDGTSAATEAIIKVVPGHKGSRPR